MEHISRKIGHAVYTIFSLITIGLVPLIIFFLSGSLDLVGEASQETYLIPGFAIGGIAFSIAGGILTGKGYARPVSIAIFLFTIPFLFYSVYNDKVLLPLNGFEYAFLSAGPLTLLTLEYSRYGVPEMFQRYILAKSAAIGSLPVVSAIIIAVIYEKMGQSQLPLVLTGILSVCTACAVAGTMLDHGNFHGVGGGD
ncbi:MAG: hypothetical protein ACYDAZ_03445 [Thermoplasmataceae archaeon]